MNSQGEVRVHSGDVQPGYVIEIGKDRQSAFGRLKNVLVQIGFTGLTWLEFAQDREVWKKKREVFAQQWDKI